MEKPNYNSRTATLYSAALEDGDYHTGSHSVAAFLLGLITPFPEKMQINRAFAQHMYKGFAREGFTHFLDVGAGPMPMGHQWAPDGNFLFVDHNPDIVQHARRKLKASDKAVYEVSSVKDLPARLESGIATPVFGNNRRIAIASNAVLMFVSDEDIRNTFAYLYNWVESGSILEITMTGVTSKEDHFRANMIRRFFGWIDAPMHIRNIDRFQELLAPWKLVKGPMPTWKWINWPPSKNTAGVGFDIYAMRFIKE